MESGRDESSSGDGRRHRRTADARQRSGVVRDTRSCRVRRRRAHRQHHLSVAHLFTDLLTYAVTYLVLDSLYVDGN